MPRNILLTSLDALENDRVLRYYAVQNEFGFDYCEAAQRMEASVEYILSRFPVDEILVLGGDMPSENGDEKKSRRLKDASANTYMGADASVYEKLPAAMASLFIGYDQTEATSDI